MNKSKKILEQNLKNEPHNIDILLKLALLEIEPPEGDDVNCARYLKQILALDKHNINALLLLAYLNYYYLLQDADENLMHSLTSLNSPCDELNSMLRYAASWFFQLTGNREKEIQFLEESINYYQGHVWNYVKLGQLYLSQGKNIEAKQLINQALDHVKKVYSDDASEYDETNISDFLNSNIKGIYLTKPLFQIIQNLLNN